jgi:DNA-binding response OmpR family regulator
MSNESKALPSNTPRILLVDDDPIALSLVQTALQLSEYEVDIASGGTAALKKLQQSHYDLMITDILMPDMMGDELIRKVREANLELPIIIWAGAFFKVDGEVAIISSSDYSVRIERRLFDEFLPKPSLIREMVVSIRNLLGQRK